MLVYCNLLLDIFFNKVLFLYLFIYCICKAPRGEDNLVFLFICWVIFILQIWPIKVSLIDISG